MKGKKKQKPRGMKRKIREEKKKEERIGLAVTVAILIIIISISGFFIHSILTSPPQKQETSSTSEPKATIVDHLSLSRPNQTFIDIATDILKQAGFAVDYYKGEEVTVEFYRNLPTHDYKIMILRVHSTAIYGQLFTSEPYSSTKYVYEQLADQVLKFSFYGEPPYYFGISPLFVKYSMKGKFQNTTIIMMGCDGLKNTDMAQEFIEKGAKVYISWDGPILGSRNDPAIRRLLQHLITGKKTVERAVADTMKEFGPTPIDNSVLLYYPLEAGDYTVQNIIGNIIVNTQVVQMAYLTDSGFFISTNR